MSGAPNLPPGFSETFTDRYVDVGGMRLHAVVGGHGRPLLLIHGWPQTWYAWRLLMPALARDFQVVAVDQRGIGLSDKPADGYDTGTQANDMVKLMDALGHQRFAVLGTDTGMPIGYALAADHPDKVERLAVAEAVIAGVTPSPPLIGSKQANDQLWHIPFNRLESLNEQLVKGREDIYFGAKLQGLPDDVHPVLRRHAALRPERSARQLRPVPRVRYHHRPEPTAEESGWPCPSWPSVERGPSAKGWGTR